MGIVVPDALVASHRRHRGADGLAWISALPGLAARFLRTWHLRLDGEPAHGVVSLVLPVLRADHEPAVLKLQPVTDENATEPVGLRTWNGDGVVRLLDHDPATGTMLLERLDAARPLSALEDDDTAVRVLGELLARLVVSPAPPGLRRLADVAEAMLAETPHAVEALRDPGERRLVRDCASAVAELFGEPGDRLLHWDLHYDNVLGAQREPWLAIDPKPLAGDPGFELLPALHNRWGGAVATGDPARAVLRRFDQLTELVGLDRHRAAGWTLGRVLQNALWDVEDGETAMAPDRSRSPRHCYVTGREWNSRANHREHSRAS